ncbi:tripartite tricarboxylate transporter TctB family protein [Niallia hominis]|uniref:tripartite tricarboxylate transporter TctB family protein n=1 Tax=Bacillaceae TaxID=186817 RepID=UPI0004E12235|nr:tripartite tricarboxylate transporter TctB family protein [Niallia circulans]HCC3140706.1 tripartite tricarboxylate transporter TctB family protein [Legionella pneumophila]
MVNRLFSIFILIVGTIFFINSNEFSEKSGVQTFAPSFFPRIIIGLMMILALCLLIKSFLSKDNDSFSMETIKIYVAKHFRVLLILFFFLLYVISLNIGGFLISSIAFLFISTIILRPLKIKYMATNIILSVAFPVIVLLVFEQVLHIYLP